MSAIITNKFRVFNAEQFKESFSEAVNTNMYLFIGRPQKWANDVYPDTPLDTILNESVNWKDMISMKKIQGSDVSHAILRRTWTAGKYYDMYRDNYDGSTGQGVDYNTGVAVTRATLYDANFYVVNSQYEVYKCLDNKHNYSSITGRNTMQVTSDEPLGTNNYEPFTTADGYTWQFMFQISAADVLKFVSTDFIPVKKLSVNPGTTNSYYTQWQAQQSAVNGSIDHIEIISGGDYSQTPTITVYGDGTGCTATAVRTGNVITRIDITNPGSGYTYAYVVITNGGTVVTAATLKPQISPHGGHASDPVRELGGYYITMNIRLEYADGAGDFPVDNDYRRIGIIRDPYDYGTTITCTSTSRTATYALQLNSISGGPFTIDEQISDTIANATVVSWDPDNGILRYIKTSNDNDIPFTNAVSVGHTISGLVSGCTANISSVISPEAQPYSGEIIYFENRRPINRADDQIEDIKIVVEM